MLKDVSWPDRYLYCLHVAGEIGAGRGNMLWIINVSWKQSRKVMTPPNSESYRRSMHGLFFTKMYKVGKQVGAALLCNEHAVVTFWREP